MAAGGDEGSTGRRAPVVVVVVVAVVVFAAVLATVGGALRDASDDLDEATDATPAPTTTSTTAPTTSTSAEPPEPVPLDALRVPPLTESTPTRYRIVYDVIENSLPRQETWTVARPYQSLVVAMRDGRIVSGEATSIDQLWTFLDDRDAWFAVQARRHRAASDLRPAAVMATMVELGLARPAGEGAFAGRSCRVFEVAEPLGSGNVSELGGAEATEVCIDDAGLVLHERWSIGGDLVLERTAIAVEIEPEIDPVIFDPTPVVEDAPEVEVFLRSIAVEADDETLAGLRTDVAFPAGFVLDGAVFRASTSEAGGANSSEVVRFWSRGPDLVEVAEVTVPGGAVLAGGSARPMEVERFDEVWFDADFRASTIRARIDDTRFLELRGTDPALLLDVLQTVTLR